jgi:opacity protein-like surface antigen
MIRRLVLGLFAISGLLLAGAAGGHLRNEVFGAIGMGTARHDEGSLGSGINGGGGFGYRLSRRFGLEAEVNAFQTTRDYSSLYPPFQASGVHAMGNGLLYLNRGRAETYLIFGAGLMHVSNSTGFAGARPGISADGFAASFGAGIEIFVTERLSLRPEFRIYAGDSRGVVEPPLDVFRFSMGIGYHW